MKIPYCNIVTWKFLRRFVPLHVIFILWNISQKISSWLSYNIWYILEPDQTRSWEVQGFSYQGKFRQQIYSIDVYTDNYLPSFFKNLFCLLLNYFLLLGCVNTYKRHHWLILMTQKKGCTRRLRWGDTVI